MVGQRTIGSGSANYWWWVSVLLVVGERTIGGGSAYYWWWVSVLLVVGRLSGVPTAVVTAHVEHPVL